MEELESFITAAEERLPSASGWLSGSGVAEGDSGPLACADDEEVTSCLLASLPSPSRHGTQQSAAAATPARPRPECTPPADSPRLLRQWAELAGEGGGDDSTWLVDLSPLAGNACPGSPPVAALLAAADEGACDWLQGGGDSLQSLGGSPPRAGAPPPAPAAGGGERAAGAQAQRRHQAEQPAAGDEQRATPAHKLCCAFLLRPVDGVKLQLSPDSTCPSGESPAGASSKERAGGEEQEAKGEEGAGGAGAGASAAPRPRAQTLAGLLSPAGLQGLPGAGASSTSAQAADAAEDGGRTGGWPSPQHLAGLLDAAGGEGSPAGRELRSHPIDVPCEDGLAAEGGSQQARSGGPARSRGADTAAALPFGSGSARFTCQPTGAAAGAGAARHRPASPDVSSAAKPACSLDAGSHVGTPPSGALMSPPDVSPLTHLAAPARLAIPPAALSAAAAADLSPEAYFSPASSVQLSVASLYASPAASCGPADEEEGDIIFDFALDGGPDFICDGEAGEEGGERGEAARPAAAAAAAWSPEPASCSDSSSGGGGGGSPVSRASLPSGGSSAHVQRCFDSQLSGALVDDWLGAERGLQQLALDGGPALAPAHGGGQGAGARRLSLHFGQQLPAPHL